MTLPNTEMTALPPYSSAEVSRLLFQSFYFSQGDLNTHSQIFAFLARNFGDRLLPEAIEEAASLTWPKAEKILAKRSLHSYQGDPEVAAYAVGEARGLLQSHLQKTEPGFDRMTLTGSLISADFGSLVGRRKPNKLGRKRKLSSGEKMTPNKDRFLSHFVYYGFMAKATAMAEFDAMFAESVENYANHPEIFESFHKRTQRLLDLYLEHHPSQMPIIIQRLGHLGIVSLSLPNYRAVTS